MSRLKNLSKDLPPIVARAKVGEYFGFIISPKTLANLASKGLGPRFLKTGRHCIYKTEDLLDWLENQITPVSTREQDWED